MGSLLLSIFFLGGWEKGEDHFAFFPGKKENCIIWNTEGTAECANDCKLIIGERTYYYHSECGTFNDKENNQNLPVTAEEKESINVILAQYITLWFRVEECAIYKGEEVIDQLEIADARSEDPDDCLKVQLWIIRW